MDRALSGTENYGYRVKARYRIEGDIKHGEISGTVWNMQVDDSETTVSDLKDRGEVGNVEITAPKEDRKVDPPVSYGQIWISVADERYCRIISERLDRIEKIHSYERGEFELEVSAAKVPLGGAGEVEKYEDTGLFCGPGAVASRWIILVEGKRDVVALNDSGYDNALAFNGSKMRRHVTEIREICKSKEAVLAFVDDDGGGRTNEKNLGKYKIRYDKPCLKAPAGSEVEYLPLGEIRGMVEPRAEKIRSQLGITPTEAECWERPVKTAWPGTPQTEPPTEPTPRPTYRPPTEPTPRPTYRPPTEPTPRPTYSQSAESTRGGDRGGGGPSPRSKFWIVYVLAAAAVAALVISVMGGFTEIDVPSIDVPSIDVASLEFPVEDIIPDGIPGISPAADNAPAPGERGLVGAVAPSNKIVGGYLAAVLTERSPVVYDIWDAGGRSSEIPVHSEIGHPDPYSCYRIEVADGTVGGSPVLSVLDYEEMGCLDAHFPAYAAYEIGTGRGGDGYHIEVLSASFSEENTRVYLRMDNGDLSRGGVSAQSSVVIQEGTEYSGYRGAVHGGYDKIESRIAPPSSDSGYLLFEPFAPEDFVLRLKGGGITDVYPGYLDIPVDLDGDGVAVESAEVFEIDESGPSPGTEKVIIGDPPPIRPDPSPDPDPDPPQLEIDVAALHGSGEDFITVIVTSNRDEGDITVYVEQDGTEYRKESRDLVNGELIEISIEKAPVMDDGEYVVRVVHDQEELSAKDTVTVTRESSDPPPVPFMDVVASHSPGTGNMTVIVVSSIDNGTVTIRVEQDGTEYRKESRDLVSGKRMEMSIDKAPVMADGVYDVIAVHDQEGLSAEDTVAIMRPPLGPIPPRPSIDVMASHDTGTDAITVTVESSIDNGSVTISVERDGTKFREETVNLVNGAGEAEMPAYDAPVMDDGVYDVTAVHDQEGLSETTTVTVTTMLPTIPGVVAGYDPDEGIITITVISGGDDGSYTIRIERDGMVFREETLDLVNGIGEIEMYAYNAPLMDDGVYDITVVDDQNGLSTTSMLSITLKPPKSVSIPLPDPNVTVPAPAPPIPGPVPAVPNVTVPALEPDPPEETVPEPVPPEPDPPSVPVPPQDPAPEPEPEPVPDPPKTVPPESDPPAVPVPPQDPAPEPEPEPVPPEPDPPAVPVPPPEPAEDPE